MEGAQDTLTDHFQSLLHGSQVPSFFLLFSVFLVIDMLIFAVMAEVSSGADNFLCFSMELRLFTLPLHVLQQ